jgi:hypothetical protein
MSTIVNSCQIWSVARRVAGERFLMQDPFLAGQLNVGYSAGSAGIKAGTFLDWGTTRKESSRTCNGSLALKSATGDGFGTVTFTLISVANSPDLLLGNHLLQEFREDDGSC